MNLFQKDKMDLHPSSDSSIRNARLQQKSYKRHPLFTGTLILSGAGLLTRLIGFYNRIYLSQLIGAKEMGIYQLIFPVYMIAFAFCCHGIELALSQMTASFAGQGKPAVHCRILVRTGTALSLISSLFFSLLIYHYAEFISIVLLKEETSSICLKLMAPVLPFTAIRCCLHGYYLGLKKTAVPAAGQLIEQSVRVLIIWLIAESYGKYRTFSAALAVCGMVIGELAGTIYTYISYKIQIYTNHSQKNTKPPFIEKKPGPKPFKNSSRPCLPYGRELLGRAVPLTATKLSLTLFSSVESVLIPFMLTSYYKDQDLALSLYGVLTGMALPFILFPSTLTNSLSVMLLPAMSEAKASGNKKQIQTTIKKTVKLCLFLGFTALAFFFLFGKKLGISVFHEQTAGDFLFILSFLCPFLYLASSGASILNGLGFMKEAFFYSITGILIRICFILFAIPKAGIQGYLIGLLAAYLVLTGLQWNKIRRSL